MSFTSRLIASLTDRIILEPSRHDIEVSGKYRRVLPRGDEQLEIWCHRSGPGPDREADLFVLRFPGTASRAEDITDLLDGSWPDLCVEAWAVNPPGYGASGGRASLAHIPVVGDLVAEQMRQVAGDRPMLVEGGSLGSVSALYVAARWEVAGVVLQNPPPLPEMIRERFPQRYLKPLGAAFARRIPDELDSIGNASRAQARALFVSAQRDEVVPPKFQRQIIEAYAGPKRVFEMPEADHASQFSEDDRARLRPLTDWLRAGFDRKLANDPPSSPAVG